MRVICLSGGLDSAVAILEDSDFYDLALTFDYGQPCDWHREPPEVTAAGVIADRAQVPHETVWVEWQCLPAVGLLGGHVGSFSESVVPGRNSLFVAAAAMRGATSVTLGCNADDQADFLDCRQEVLKAVGVACGVEVRLPMIGFTKAQIVELSKNHALHIDDIVTCYRGTGCGECASCRQLAACGV